jgi:hypothetical protein
MMRFLCVMVTTMILVKSSAIHAVGYDGSTLAVEFHSGPRLRSSRRPVFGL